MSNKKICYIFAAGDFSGNFTYKENDLIIAADAGYKHLEKLYIKPDILLGDFDSLKVLPDISDIVRHPVIKDYTDSQLAVEEGIKRGYSNFVICGAIGGKRLEHTISNLQSTVGYAEKSISVILTDGECVVEALHNDTLYFDASMSGFVSVFCFSGKAEGVNLRGLKYPLENAVLHDSFPLGVSNEFMGTNSEISVRNGTLVLIYNKKLF